MNPIDFIFVDPKARRVSIGNFADLTSARKHLGLDDVDFGSLYRREDSSGLSIVVDGQGLRKPVGSQSYFSLGGRLYAGAAIIFAYDPQGETRSISQREFQTASALATFYDSVQEIEAEIVARTLQRPENSVNGKVFWQWNVPEKQASISEVVDAAVNSEGRDV